MSLGLNLATARAKVEWASAHLDTLQGRLRESPKDAGVWRANARQIEKNPAIWEVELILESYGHLGLSLIVGDAIHNLRCALDYIVVALAEVSETKVTTAHQFPIFIDGDTYKAKVGTVDTPTGPLVGLKHGVGLIQELQPYHRKDEPRSDPLWHVYRFSNADKHRQLIPGIPIPRWPPDLTFDSPDGQIVDVEFVDPPPGVLVEAEAEGLPGFTPKRELPAAVIRFVGLGPHLTVHNQVKVVPTFAALPFGRETGHGVAPSFLRKSCDHVRMVVDLFEQV